MKISPEIRISATVRFVYVANQSGASIFERTCRAACTAWKFCTMRHRRGPFGDIYSGAAILQPKPQVYVVSPRALRLVTLGRSGEAKCRKSSRIDNMGAFLRKRNANQSEGASDSASVLKHEVSVCGHGGHRGYLEGPRGEYRLFEVPFCEYAMRGSPRPHPTLIVPSNTKWAYAFTGDMPVVGFSESPGVNITYWRSHFANT